MIYESRYDWTGEKTRRTRIARRIIGIALVLIFVGATAVATLLM
jgi:hypothetical protein